jgi:hypothetical protein
LRRVFQYYSNRVTLKGRVNAGRLVVDDEPIDLSEAPEVTLLPLDPGDSREE